MNHLLLTLKKRNTVLYRYGWLCLACTVICALVALLSPIQVMGINAFIKPIKFFVSITIFCWTMGWFSGLLAQRRAVSIYSWVIIIILSFEMIVIVGQASLGKLSHFNIHSAFDGALFSLMGIGITVATLWTAYIGFLFWVKSPVDLPTSYLWGIRLGFLFFVLFAFEGFAMASRLAHTVGAPDGGPGLPLFNWSTRHGDLRIAHFFGMHALQLIPLFGYYVSRRLWQIMLFAAIYAGFVTLLLMQALAGKPLLAIYEPMGA